MQKTVRFKVKDAGVDQRAVVAPTDIESARDEHLRKAKCLRILGAAHSPIWGIPHIVNRLSSEFFKELTGRRSD